MKKDIEPRNHKNQRHGLWIWYYANDKIMLKGQFINGIRHGYWIENWLHFDKHQITLHLK